MTKLTNPDEIWTLRPTRDDLLKGARYAAITLPWTFNRMMFNTGSAGQQQRGLNIAKGVVGQEALRTELIRRGIAPEVEEKSHRDKDLFDLNVQVDGKVIGFDFKTINYFTDYEDVGREPFSHELLIANSTYPGPDWRRFFPMLIPHTQVGQDKEAYCFAIASSIDFRNNLLENRDESALTAYPYGEPLPFLCNRALCVIREETSQGFYVNLTYAARSLLADTNITLRLVGEWDGTVQELDVALAPNETKEDIGPFSCLSAFQIPSDDFEHFYGGVEVAVSRNDLDIPVRNTTGRQLNAPPEEVLIISPSDFCNLILPNDYEIHVIGWTRKRDFLKNCRKYNGWVWPDDAVNKFENQAWTQITERDLASIERAGFEDRIQRTPSLLKAGWMKTSGGRGGNACCYVFPNVRRGGIRETNLFVLPADLNVMDELVD